MLYVVKEEIELNAEMFDLEPPGSFLAIPIQDPTMTDDGRFMSQCIRIVGSDRVVDWWIEVYSDGEPTTIDPDTQLEQVTELERW